MNHEALWKCLARNGNEARIQAIRPWKSYKLEFISQFKINLWQIG